MNPFATTSDFDRTLAQIRRIVQGGSLVQESIARAAAAVATHTHLTAADAAPLVAEEVRRLAVAGKRWPEIEHELLEVVARLVADVQYDTAMGRL